jgi:hypothetical protein
MLINNNNNNKKDAPFGALKLCASATPALSLSYHARHHVRQEPAYLYVVGFQNSRMPALLGLAIHRACIGIWSGSRQRV